MEVELIILIIGALILLVCGDRIGWKLACMTTRRCSEKPLVNLPIWIAIPTAILIPLGVFFGLFKITFRVENRITHEAFADNLELLLLEAFFITGLIGGFLTRIRIRRP